MRNKDQLLKNQMSILSIPKESIKHMHNWTTLTKKIKSNWLNFSVHLVLLKHQLLPAPSLYFLPTQLP